MVKLAMSKEVDLGEVLNPALEGRPLFEDVSYDSNIASEIFMDEDESFNIGERNTDGPKAPRLNNLKTDNSESLGKKDEKNLNPDIQSHSSSFSTHIIVFAGLIVYLQITIFWTNKTWTHFLTGDVAGLCQKVTSCSNIDLFSWSYNMFQLIL